MKFYILERNRTLYHGASRLYQIICFIRTNQEAWQRYLDTSPLYIVEDEKELPPGFITEFRKYYQIRWNRYAPSPISNEVLFILTVLLLQQFKIDDLSVNRVWNVLLSENTPDAVELTNFAYDVETKAHNLLELTSSSSFHIPVRFFSDSFNHAYRYGDKMFAYHVKKDIQLLDLSYAETRDELSRTVFASKEPFSLELIRYHTIFSSIESLRLLQLERAYGLMGVRLFDFLNKFMSPFKPLVDMERHHSEVETFDDLLNTRNNLINHPLFSTLSIYWKSFFRIELISPYGLWMLSNSNLPRFRLTPYSSDALLLRVLYDDGRYQGYYNLFNEELAVFDPDKYGQLYYLDISKEGEKEEKDKIDLNLVDPATDSRFTTIDAMNVNMDECPKANFLVGNG